MSLWGRRVLREDEIGERDSRTKKGKRRNSFRGSVPSDLMKGGRDPGEVKLWFETFVDGKRSAGGEESAREIEGRTGLNEIWGGWRQGRQMLFLRTAGFGGHVTLEIWSSLREK